MSDQTTISQNLKASSDHLERQSSKTNNTSLLSKQQSILHKQSSDSDKKANPETSSNLNSNNSSNEHLNNLSNNSSCESVSGVEQSLYENNCNTSHPSHNYFNNSFNQKSEVFSQYYKGNIQYCKNHPSKEVTKICLHAGCSLTREICNECEKQQPHSSHSSSIVDAKRFFVDVELSLKEFCINSPLMNAADMFEQGKQFILRHFQSMNNMLVEKAPGIVKILALIESTENAKRIPLKTYELERYIRDIMGIFSFNKSGKLEYHLQQQLHDNDIAKEEIRSVLFMLRDLENVVRYLHDDFAKALKFGEYNSQREGNHNWNHKNNINVGFQHQSSFGSNQNHHQICTSQDNEIDGEQYIKSTNDQGPKCNNNYKTQQINEGYSIKQSHLNNSLPQNNITSSYNKNGNLKNWGQQSVHSNINLNDNIESEGTNNLNMKSKINQPMSSINTGADSNGQLSSNQLITTVDVLNDPAFLKRPRGRPKGSKCKRKGKNKGKYTDNEKLQILQEVVNNKSIQVIAEKYRIQKSFIRYWARQLKFELDPQTITSRRPYRIFTKEQKNIIVQEAIKRRDIVIVAQEYDVNAQVLKRWILKSAQGSLNSSEIRQMMNAVPNINEDDDEDDENSQSQYDSDVNSDQDEDEDDDEMGDENIEQNDEFDNINSENNSLNYLNQYENNSKVKSPKQKQDTKVKFGDRNLNIQNQDIIKMEQSIKEQQDQMDIKVKDEEVINQEIHQNKNQMQKQEDNEINKQKIIKEEDESDEENSYIDSDDEENDVSLSIQDQVQKKIKPNDNSRENFENLNPNKNIDKKQQSANTLNDMSIKQNMSQLKTKSVNEILNFDVLKTVNLTNLDLLTNTEEQSEKLKMMQKKIEDELQKMKQQQKEIKLKKQISEQKKSQSTINQLSAQQ